MGVGFTQVASTSELPVMPSYGPRVVLTAGQPAAVAAPALPALPVLPPAAPLPLAQPAPLPLV